MGLDIHGWIEITVDEEVHDATMWTGVTRLAPLVDAPDAFSEAVFGFSKKAVGETERVRRIASGRGLPAACSPEVLDDIARIRQHEGQYGRGDSAVTRSSRMPNSHE